MRAYNCQLHVLFCLSLLSLKTCDCLIPVHAGLATGGITREAEILRRDKTPGRPGSERKGMQTKPPKHQMPHITAVPCIMDSIGEDEASHERQIKILSLEWKKSKPNKHAVSELMRRTFTVRRERILSSPVPMDSLISTYKNPLGQVMTRSVPFVP